MIPCPNCHQSIEIEDKHLGTLFTCPHCSAVYFIDWNGQPELATHESEQESGAATPEFSSDQNDFQQFQSPPEPGSIPYFQENEPSSSDENPQVQNETVYSGSIPYSSDDSEQTFEPPQSEYSSAAEEAPYDFNQPLDHASVEQPTVEHAASSMSSADFSDVMEFANSNANVGPLSYAVIIEGIESSHLLIQLKEAMTDSRFGWDVAGLLEQVGGGRLVLSGLSPAKASVLVSRIKYLPLKISWRQDVLSST